ncbi:glycosyl transferase [Pseudonocardiaceae bacterium YIM PH 21723]|nr:glycosyl transferase [Pseudonocardiaceae bacterium YIM PH 21723]
MLFVTLMGHGHVTPTLALVEELVRRGRHVEYATSPEHADAVRAAGADWVELPQPPPFIPLGEDILAAWFRHYFAAMTATYPVLLAHCRTRRPELICYDATNWPARLVAEQLEIRAVRTVPHLASNDSFSLYPPGATGLLTEDCARFSAAHGVALEHQDTLDRPERSNLVFLPREFQPSGDTFDETFHFVGPLLGDRTDEPWTPKHPELPLVYASLGSVLSDPRFYDSCVEAFADGAWQVALNGRVDRAPANFDVRDWFPQPAVLRRARAFVTHAGMNSTMEALFHGVPLVAVPQTPEQEINARRIEELGLGERLTGDLRSTVERVAASEEIRRNLDRMRAAILAGGGVQRAAGLLV